MALFRAAIGIFAVTLVLNLIPVRDRNTSRPADPYHFTARGRRVLILIGCCGVGLMTLIELAVLAHHEEPLPTLLTVLLTFLVALPGLPLCLAPLPGFWEIRVDGDDITVTKLFRIRTHWKISDIGRCEAVSGELRVYMRGQKKAAFPVDALFDHYNTFVERMKREQIPIVYQDASEGGES